MYSTFQWICPSSNPNELERQTNFLTEGAEEKILFRIDLELTTIENVQCILLTKSAQTNDTVDVT